MQIFGIFEGGGAKGLAHVGAIAVAQELGVQFVGVAGASAGAIVAALIAVGYAPKQVYDPITQTGLLAGDLTDLFGPDTGTSGGDSPIPLWERWKAARFCARGLPRRSSIANGVLRSVVCWWTMASSTPLRSRTRSIAGCAPARFAFPPISPIFCSKSHPSIVPPLRIIASDIDRQAPVVFSRERTPDIAVAKAVAASIGLPFFFRPVRLTLDGEERTLVDGGLVANFPVWIFDDARRRRRADPTRSSAFVSSSVPTRRTTSGPRRCGSRARCSRPR